MIELQFLSEVSHFLDFVHVLLLVFFLFLNLCLQNFLHAFQNALAMLHTKFSNYGCGYACIANCMCYFYFASCIISVLFDETLKFYKKLPINKSCLDMNHFDVPKSQSCLFSTSFNNLDSYPWGFNFYNSFFLRCY